MRSTTSKRESGSTKRGVPDNYTGTNASLCNAATKSGRPCRALKLRGGRCKWHGGLSTGPRTPEGKAKAKANLKRSVQRWIESRNGCVPAALHAGANDSTAQSAESSD